MNYTINQLKIFHKIVETRSITKASQELYMTQPAVSIQLKNFQDQFEIPLTELKGRKIHITDFGMEIAEIAENALSQLHNLQFKTKEYKGVITGKLKISSASTGKYVIPFFLSQFLDDHPGIDLSLDVTNKTHVVHDLKNRDVELAVVSVLPEDLEVEEEKLMDNKLYLVSNANESNKKKPLIFRESGSATRKEMEKYFRKKSKRERGRIELTSNEAVKQAVIAGIGHSILPLIGIKNELEKNELKIIERKSLPITTQWRVVWLKDKELSPVANAFIEYLRSSKNQILSEKFKWYMNY